MWWTLIISLIGNGLKAGIGFIPPKVLFYSVLSLLLLGGSGYIGWKIRDYRAAQEHLEAVQRAVQQAKEQAEIDRGILEEGFEVQREIEVRYKTIYREAESVATPECTHLSSDWVRVFNDAIREAQ